MQHNTVHPQVHTPQMEQPTVVTNNSTENGPFNQYPFNNQHITSATVPSTMNASQNSGYVLHFYTYDEQMLPYSTSSVSPASHSQTYSDSDNSHLSNAHMTQMQPDRNQGHFNIDTFNYTNDSTNVSSMAGNSDFLSYNSSELNGIEDLDPISIQNLIDQLRMDYGTDLSTLNHGFANNMYSSLVMDSTNSNVASEFMQ